MNDAEKEKIRTAIQILQLCIHEAEALKEKEYPAEETVNVIEIRI